MESAISAWRKDFVAGLMVAALAFACLLVTESYVRAEDGCGDPPVACDDGECIDGVCQAIDCSGGNGNCSYGSQSTCEPSSGSINCNTSSKCNCLWDGWKSKCNCAQTKW
jgi:hypothetical protein